MDRWEKGMLAKSLAGHDKEKIYVIISIEENHIFLVDGVARTLDRPKKKKKKHVQLIRQKHPIENVDDADIKCILSEYKKTEKTESREES